MPTELDKAYDPKAAQQQWLKFWDDNKYFHSEPDPARKPFTIVIPPPNVTGALHMGHALNNTLQDVLIRWRRMQGYNALWMPGTDHAGIARARDEALDVLKPSPAQLQRGLELHRNSLVFDAYGFAPRAAIDGDAMAQAEADGASDAELESLREEMMMTRPALVAREREEFLNAMKVAGVDCIFQNAGEESSDPLVLMKRLAHFTYLGDMMRGGAGASRERRRIQGIHDVPPAFVCDDGAAPGNKKPEGHRLRG